MLSKDKQWNILCIDDSFSPEHPKKTWKTHKYSVVEEIEKDGKLYYKVGSEEQTILEYLMREDTDEKKVFIRYEEGNTNWEELMYDFGMNVGDTLSYTSWGIQYTLRVDSIRSIEYMNGFETKIFYNSCRADGENEYFPCGNWIEGMGTTYNIIPKQPIGLLGEYLDYELLCFSQNDELLYKSSNYSTCDENYLSTNDLSDSKIKILTNPVRNRLQVELNDYSVWKQYRIINTLGSTILESVNISSSDLSIDLSKVKTGTYIFQMMDKYGKFGNCKFVITR